MKKLLLLTLALGFGTCLFAQDLTNARFGKGLRVMAKDSSFYMRYGMRFQTLYEAKATMDSSFSYYDDVSDKLLIRRSRFKFDGWAFTPKLKWKLEMGLSNRDIGKAGAETNLASKLILDAVGKWNFADGFELWFGQTKLPGNRERVISSANLQMVDRSLVNSRFNIDRDVGVQLRHKWKIGEMIIKEIACISQGEGRNITAANVGGYEYTGRIEVLPFGKFAGKGDYVGSDIVRQEKPKLSLAVTYDYNDNSPRERGNLGSYMIAERDLESIHADMMFKYQGFTLTAEYAQRDAILPVLYDDDGNKVGAFYTGNGFMVMSGYVFKNNWSIDGRYTQIDPEDVTGRAFHEQYTLGVSKYVVGHALKIQSDISYLTEVNDDPELMYRLQVDIHF